MKSTLPVVEYFHSIQGEGAHTGKSAFFIRLAGCSVGCKWCDTKESWSIKQHKIFELHSLAAQTKLAQANGASFLVLTGGEPLEHDLNPLCKVIREITSTNGKEPLPIHIETSGVNPISGSPNWITLSPKQHMPPKIETLKSCHEIKVIIHSEEDLIFAEKIARLAEYYKSKQASRNQHFITTPLLFLQPGWNNEKGTKLAISYVKSNPQWRLSMQTHKWLGVT